MALTFTCACDGVELVSGSAGAAVGAGRVPAVPAVTQQRVLRTLVDVCKDNVRIVRYIVLPCARACFSENVYISLS